MSTYNLKKILAACLLVVAVFACKKSFLEVKPNGTLDEPTLTDTKGLNKLLVGAYAMLDNYDPGIEHDQFGVSASNSVLGEIGAGVANKGSELSDQADLYTPVERHEVIPLNNLCNNQWRVLYEGIKRTNEVLRLLAKVTSGTAADKKNIEGQARFLRAWYHFQGRIVFKHFAFIDVKTDDDLNAGAIQGVSNQEEIFPKILEDVKFAYDNLPAAQDAVGRVNKWNAGAFYGKVLLFTKDYPNARTVLTNVVDNGVNPLGVKYDLNANFADNFNIAFENSKEAVFSFQASAQDNAGAGNSNWGDVLNTPPNAGGGAGFYTPTYFFVNNFKTDGAGLPLANPQDKNVVDPYGQPGYSLYAGTVDPRLDWTVGRNGIPYLDWGIVDNSWIRNDGSSSTAPYSSGPFEPMKNCIRQSQVGKANDASVWFVSGGVSLNVNLIRFSDVLLMAAEAEVMDAGGSINKAWTYVNRVRSRAASTATVKKYINNADPKQGFTNVDAGSYKAAPYPAVFGSQAAAMKAIQLERLLELGMEGQRFFDLVRWGIAQTELNAFYTYESQFPYAKLLQVPGVPSYTAAEDDYYPVPQKQIDLGFGFTKP